MSEEGTAPTAGTRTFLFADLRGYTSFVERRGDAAAAELIGAYRRIVRAEVARTAGAEIKTEGDSFYVVFDSAGAALRCGSAIQVAARDARTEEMPIHVGIGIHAGEPVPHEGQFVGSAVNVAARLGQAAGPDELVVSDLVRALLRTSAVPPMRERMLRLKGVDAPMRAYAVDWTSPARSAVAATPRPVGRRIVGALAAAIIALAAVAALFVVPTVFAPSDPRPRLVTVAGLGTLGFSGDGGPAAVAQLDEPTSLAFDAAGNLYVADSTFQLNAQGVREPRTRIRAIDPQGTIRTLTGDGTESFPFEGAPLARFATLISFARVWAEPDGTLYVAAGGPADQVVIEIGRDGRIRVVVGFPRPTASGLNRPRGLVRDRSGDLYVADSGNNVVRKVARDGTLTTVAGTGERGDAPDRGDPTKGALFAPVAVAISPDGSLFIADTNNHKVRKIDHGGQLVTVAGNGQEGFSGDGGPATRARLALPQGLAFDRAGALYIADSGNGRIRMVRPDGTITTVAGDGREAELSHPSAVAIDAKGVLYIADAGNHRIRRLDLGSSGAAR